MSDTSEEIAIIKYYAPSADESDSFYKHIKVAMEKWKNHKINIVIGDFNAKVGHDSEEGVTRRYGLGERIF